MEYHLSAALKNLDDIRYKYLWCDGVATPNEHLLIPAVVVTKKTIATTAWLGPTGQDMYQMTVRLGPISLQHYFKNESIIECLPDASKASTWIDLDADARKISILLQ